MPELRTLLRPLAIAASGLRAQRVRMDVIAENIANAETTRTEAGGPYRRKVVDLVPRFDVAQPGTKDADGLLATNERGHFAHGIEFEWPPESSGVEIAGIREDTSEGALVYDPAHPDANAEGYVMRPNVDLTTEMVDLMQARRMYDANATSFEAMKHVLRTALDL